MSQYTVTLSDGNRAISGLAAAMEDFAFRNGYTLVGVSRSDAPATVKAAVVVTERTDLPFKAGDKVFVTGVLAKGQGTVLACWCNIPHPKYDREGQGHPQVEVKLLSGKTYHYNADDIRAGKITKLA